MFYSCIYIFHACFFWGLEIVCDYQFVYKRIFWCFLHLSMCVRFVIILYVYIFCDFIYVYVCFIILWLSS